MSFLRTLTSLAVIFATLGVGIPAPSHAQEAAAPTTLPEAGPEASEDSVPVEVVDEFVRAEVVEVVSARQEEFGINGTQPFIQEVRVRFLSGSLAGQEEVLDWGTLDEDRLLSVGDTVVAVQSTVNGKAQSFVFEEYRLPRLAVLGVIFAILAIIFAGWRGITSLLGLGVSVGVLAVYVVPSIMAGQNPLLVSLVAAALIAVLAIYLAHGVSRRTTAAVISTILTVAIALGLSVAAVAFLNLSGTGSEEAYFLQTAPVQITNLSGLLLGAIIIGALGVLDDITTAQAAAVQELWRANPKLSRRELITRATRIGKEHIVSLVNTLALAYVGASLPALLLFTAFNRPWWVVANTELMVEEIVRTLVGSTALMVAVPITTFLAAYLVTKDKASPTSPNPTPNTLHSH